MFLRTLAALAAMLTACVLSLPAQSAAGAPAAVSAAQATSKSDDESTGDIPASVREQLAKLKEQLTAAQSAKSPHDEAAALIEIGGVYQGIVSYQKALDSYRQALDLAKSVDDKKQQVAALSGETSALRLLGQYDRALATGQEGVELARQAADLRAQATLLNNLANVYLGLGDRQEALDYYDKSLSLDRQLGDRLSEARALTNVGLVYKSTGSPQKSVEVLTRALEIFRQLGDIYGQAGALNSIGNAYKDLGQVQKALDCYNEVLSLARQIHNRQLEARVLNNIGIISKDRGQLLQALDYYGRALAINRELGDRADQAVNLVNTAVVEDNLGEPGRALESYDQALAICRQLGERDDEAAALTNVGDLYGKLGQPQKALDYFNQALVVEHQLGERDNEARNLDNIGLAYFDLGEKQKTLDYYARALELYRQVGDRDGQADVLNDRGYALSALNEPGKALDDLGQALTFYRDAEDRSGEANTLANLGVAYSKMGDTQKSVDAYDQALPVATEVADPILEALVCYYIMEARSSAQPTLAIYFGKQAVNHLQQVRGNLRGLGSGVEKSFLAYKDSYYHDLAKLLIDRGRLPEAEQVLDLLKQQEYSDYIRGTAPNFSGPLSLTPAELEAQNQYEASTAMLITVSQQWEQLRKIASRTPEQEKQLQQLSDAMAKANQALNDYYGRLYKLFGLGAEANKQVADVKGDVAALRGQIAHAPRTVALYTVLTADRYSVIVITANAMVAREYPISEKDLNQKVAAFQQVLRDPGSDPRPLGQELWKILIGPIQSDLDQAHAETLVWSLDGVLRYIPMAALYDGKHYLVEKYNNVAITPASIGRLSERPRMDAVTAAAMGISRQYDASLPPLPAVVTELDDIIRDPAVHAADGVLSGSILLNGQFTEKAMETQLDGQHAIVHIASHFVFRPGDDNASWLLLAGKDTDSGGYHLTVADFRDNPNLRLDDTALLTLSACETGVGGNAGDGREVDGLATTAQLKGAQAVISSLWSVNDASTGLLMADFYKRWADGGGKVMKAEALRQAQLDLLRGKASGKKKAAGRGVSAIDDRPAALAGFTHPYYWAPFILMGNWQ